MRERIIKVLGNFNEEIVSDMNANLLANGILDSFDIVNLVVELEGEFGIDIDIELVTPENFESANAIIDLVQGILN